MFKVPFTRSLCALLSAALITFHLPAQAEPAERIGSVNTATFSQQALPAVGGPPSDAGMNLSAVTKALAVSDFSNDTGDTRYDNLKRGISESLVTKLARRPELHLVERSQLDKAIKELGFGQTDFADSSKAAQIGRMTGAGVIVTGSLVKAGSKMEINVRMLDVETSKVLVSESYLFQSEDDILPVVNYLSLLIPKKLNLYVSDTELEMTRGQLKGVSVKSAEDNSWIYWAIGGGVLIVGAIVTGTVLVARANAKANEWPDIMVANPRTGKVALRAQNPNLFSLPPLKF